MTFQERRAALEASIQDLNNDLEAGIPALRRATIFADEVARQADAVQEVVDRFPEPVEPPPREEWGTTIKVNVATDAERSWPSGYIGSGYIGRFMDLLLTIVGSGRRTSQCVRGIELIDRIIKVPITPPMLPGSLARKCTADVTIRQARRLANLPREGWWDRVCQAWLRLVSRRRSRPLSNYDVVEEEVLLRHHFDVPEYPEEKSDEPFIQAVLSRRKEVAADVRSIRGCIGEFDAELAAIDGNRKQLQDRGAELKRRLDTLRIDEQSLARLRQSSEEFARILSKLQESDEELVGAEAILERLRLDVEKP